MGQIAEIGPSRSTAEDILTGRVWIVVEDLFIWKETGRRPSGFQRLQSELYRAMVALPRGEERIRFVRYDTERKRFQVVPWVEVEALCESICHGEIAPHGSAPRNPEVASHSAAPSVHQRARSMPNRIIRTLYYALPPGARHIALLQLNVFTAIADLVKARLAAPIHRFRCPAEHPLSECTAKGSQGAAPEPLDPCGKSPDVFSALAKPGDIFAIFGCGWLPGFSAYAERAVRDRGLRLAVLIYDIIPLRRPEWFDGVVETQFRSWLDSTLPMAGTVLTISAATAADVTSYAKQAGISLQSQPIPIPIGSGFKRSGAAPPVAVDGMRRQLPPLGSYALSVSTIEVRKNHLLLFRVWRRLLEELPADAVPSLVFVGRIGWQVSDLMQQLKRSKFLDGRIIHFEDPSDAQLESLYRGCLFTLYPSFYEGWGLPVTESLIFGRPCIASNATSIPEAGGRLARYIDPDNVTDAYRVIRKTIENRADLSEWGRRVRREFRPVPWRESARAAMDALDSDVKKHADEHAAGPTELLMSRCDLVDVPSTVRKVGSR